MKKYLMSWGPSCTSGLNGSLSQLGICVKGIDSFRGLRMLLSWRRHSHEARINSILEILMTHSRITTRELFTMTGDQSIQPPLFAGLFEDVRIGLAHRSKRSSSLIIHFFRSREKVYYYKIKKILISS